MQRVMLVLPMDLGMSCTENSFTGVSSIMEENHYYPFGLKHKACNAQEYINNT